MKKTLSIILAILMIVTSVPMAFAADDYAVVDTEAGTVTIDGTLGGKTTATEEDLNAMVEILKNCVESGITTVIVTGSQPAKLLKDGFLTPLTSLAFEQLTYVYQDEKTDSYWGTVDLIYQDVTEIVEWEFYVCDVLKSITLPKVTTVGGYAFWALYYLETLTFGSVVTDISYQSFEVFYDLGYEIGGCNLVLNCGQLDAEFDYQPNLEDNTWWSHGSTGEWKSITLTHNGGEATCVAKAVCETCGEEYGEFDANKHTLVQKDAKAPTCSAAGYEAYEYCTACDYTTYEELPKEIFHKDADKNNKCDDCSAELAFEINRNGELLYYDNPYIQGFQALYDAAQDGDVITLLRDVFAYTIYIRKELTYDLNGFNIITASSRSINIYDNVTIRDSVGGGEIHLAVYIGAPCTIEGGMFYSLGVDSGITLDSILSPCAGYYDYKGNAIDTTGKTSIDDAYVIENHTEGDIYNCLGYKCAVCEKYYGEPNPDGHEYTEGVCDLCGYDCPHTETYETVTKPEHFSVQNPDGTWTKATVGVVCRKCYEILEEKEADRADYTEFDEILEKICEYLDSGKLIDNAYNDYSSAINSIKNNPYIIGSPFQSTPDGYIEELNRMLSEIEAGIADGTAVKVDGIEILLEYQDELRENLIKKYGEENYNNLMNSTTDEVKEKAIAIEEAAEALTGTVAENAEKIAEIKASFKALFDEAELCLAGTHSYTYEEISPAKCGENAVEEGACWFCGETVTREAEDTALTHSFTKYEVTEEAKCGIEGKEVAACDHGCGATDEKAIDALTHTDADGDYICDNGCGHEFEKPAPEEPSDDVCEDCGRPAHEGEINEFICLILSFLKLLYTFIMAIK